MIVILEAADIIKLLQRAVAEQYRTPNVAVADKSLKKLQKLTVEFSVVNTPARVQQHEDLIGGDTMHQLAQRMQVDSEPDTINAEFNDSGL